MNIIQALQWPYKKENWISAILIPGAIAFAQNIIILSFMAVFLTVFMGFVTMPNSSLEELGIVVGLGFFLIFLALLASSMVLHAPIYGYYWELIDVIQSQGATADSPRWSGRIKEYSINGLKLACLHVLFSFSWILIVAFLSMFLFILPPSLAGVLSLVFMLLYVFVFITVFLITPYLFATFVHSAETKSFKELFNIKKTLALGTRHYPLVLLMTFLMLIAGWVYLIAIGNCFCLSLITPLLLAPYWVSCVHLLTQAFSDNKDDLNPAVQTVDITEELSDSDDKSF